MSGSGLRGTFNEDAELYHRRRPGYPPDLLDALFALAELGPGARVLEIGPGTGQATRSLVERGAHVVAVELGIDLAAVLARELSEEPVDVVTAAFEDYESPKGQFDAVVAFTAWHWLDSSIRATRAAEALRPGGSLATIATWHVAGGSTAFFADAQGCYEQWDPATPPGAVLPAADDMPIDEDEVDRSERFAPAIRRRFQQEITYATRDYLDLLRTYSGHRAMPDDRRRELLDCIGSLMDRAYGGQITKRYLYELRVARRL